MEVIYSWFLGIISSRRFGKHNNYNSNNGVAVAAAPTIKKHMKLIEYFSFYKLIYLNMEKLQDIYNILYLE